MKRLQITISNDEMGETVGMLLEHKLHLSKRSIMQLKHYEKGILINGVQVSVRRVVHLGDVLEVLFDPDEEKNDIIPIEMDLDIIYEDEDILVINKPVNMAVNPSLDYPTGSLGNGIVHYLQQHGENTSYHPVNHLDKDTTGLVLVAKNAYVYSRIDPLKLKKRYLALVEGDLHIDGFIEAPIARESENSICRSICPKGKYARTEYNIRQRYLDFTEVEIVLTTGRTHQIRVHFAYIGHPLLGDCLYGTPHSQWSGQALHAYEMTIEHPITGKQMVFDVEPSVQWLEFIENAKNNRERA